MTAILLGESHSDCLRISTEIARILCLQGRYRSAEEIIWRSLSKYKHKNTGDIYELEAFNFFASILNEQGFYTQGMKLHVGTLQSIKALLGQEHPSTLASMHKLALAYHNQGHWKEAEDLLVPAVEAMKRVLGQEHLYTLTSMHNIAPIYQGQGHWKEAENLQVLVVETRRRVLGQDHPHTLISMANLASI